MRITLQLIENSIIQDIPSIILSINLTKYIFNVPSCFQRYTKDHRTKHARKACYFFTKVSASTIAGLNGYMLTMFETGGIEAKLYLNQAMYEYMEEVRYKMGFKILPFSYCSWKGSSRLGINDDDIIKQLIKKQQFPLLFKDMQNYIKNNIPQQKTNNSKLLLESNNYQYFKDQQVQIQPFHIISNGQCITNYICKPKPIPGKVFSQKIKQLKIPVKLINQIITSGQLQLPDGRIIFKNQIQAQNQPSPNTLILHLNELNMIQLIFNNNQFKQYITNKNNNTALVIYLIQNSLIVDSEQFRMLVKSFSQQTEHILCVKNFIDSKYNIQKYVYQHMQLVSNLSKLFPLCLPNILLNHENQMKRYIENSKNIQQLFPGHSMHISKRCYEMTLYPTKIKGYKLIVEDSIESQQLIPPQQYKFFNEDTNMEYQLPFNPKQCNPKVIFLGTGSMKPSRFRNVSSLLIQLDQNHSIILDCGEGTLCQLSNHYLEHQFEKKILNIQVIFITHIHSDHNLGILDLISYRNKLMKKYNHQQKLVLIIPCNVYPWYYSFIKHIEDLSIGCSLLFIQTIRKQQYSVSDATFSKDQRCRTKNNMSQDSSEQISTKIFFQSNQVSKLFKSQQTNQLKILNQFNQHLEKLGIINFYPVPVIHCPQSYGIIIQHKSKVKISYSGDTRPAPEFIKAAKNSTLMIHQATFGDDLLNNAISNAHSTVGQAMSAGIESESWKTALTHFSQRYISAKQIIDPKIYKTNQKLMDYLIHHTIVAHDHVAIKMSDGPLLPSISQQISRTICSQQ